MGRRIALHGVAATLAVGVGLWFTRAALDVFGDQTVVRRVAMLPDWPELIGLVVLAAIVLLLARALLEAVTSRRQTWRSGYDIAGPELLLPFLSLFWLALPYLPWLPDLVPAWRAVAGPLRFGVWILVCGQVAWMVAERMFRRAAGDGAEAAGRRHAAAAAFVLGLLIFGGAAGRLTGTPVYPRGDEPHYLLIAHSLWHDRDFRVDDNYARRDQRAYFRGELEPAVVTGPGGAAYSIHPIGLPLVTLPAYAAGGYPLVVTLLVCVAALAAALMWQWTVRHTGSTSAAWLAWMAVACSAPFVLVSFAIYPDVLAALCVMVVVTWPAGAHDTRRWAAACRGATLGLLPWLGATYVPMAAVLFLFLAWRMRTVRESIAAASIPFAASLAGWLVFAEWLWGSPLPLADGETHAPALGRLLTGASSLLVDQEYGVLPYAPALVLALPGLRRLWREGGLARIAAAESGAAFAALAATAGAFQVWWGGSSPPGRPLVAALPLLGLPIARWAADAAPARGRAAAGRLLVLAGLAITGALVFARQGLLVSNHRDGASELLEWLAPARELVRLAPSGIAYRDEPAVFVGVTAIWLAAAALAAAATRRITTRNSGRAAVLVAAVAVGALTAAAVTVPLMLGSRLQPPVAPELRSGARMLDAYDARRRPLAVVYDPWRPIDPLDVPPLFRFEATPGARRQPQPRRVLLNMRLSLPAGDYTATAHSARGAMPAGTIGLQIGRIGDPLVQWTVAPAPGEPWTQAFTLPVDAAFVGLRATPELEAAVQALVVEPVGVVNESERRKVPPVLSAARYNGVTVTFHGEEAYPERAGFWVRGRSSLLATFALPAAGEREPGVRLSMHSGAASPRVTIETARWATTVDLQPGISRHVHIPAAPGQRLLPVRISPDAGFVPAERDGGGDERLLGCWVEVLE